MPPFLVLKPGDEPVLRWLWPSSFPDGSAGLTSSQTVLFAAFPLLTNGEMEVKHFCFCTCYSWRWSISALHFCCTKCARGEALACKDAEGSRAESFCDLSSLVFQSPSGPNSCSSNLIRILFLATNHRAPEANVFPWTRCRQPALSPALRLVLSSRQTGPETNCTLQILLVTKMARLDRFPGEN